MRKFNIMHPPTRTPQTKPAAKVGKRGRRTRPILAHGQSTRRDMQRGIHTNLPRS